MADDDEYDLEAVEAQLARMQQRRSHRLHALQSSTQVAPPLSPSQQHHMFIPAATSEFELNEADLSSLGSDSEDGCNSDCDSNSTNSLPSDDEARGSGRADPGQRLQRATKRPKARVRDSLDLSMSITELSKPPKARANSRKPSAKAADASPSGHKADQQQQLDTKPTSGAQSGQVSLGKTGHSGRGAGDGAWMSNLVQRRRQLEKDAALTKDQVVDSTTATVAATQLANLALVQNAKTRGTQSKTSNSVSSPQDTQRAAPDNCTKQRVPTNHALEMDGYDHLKKLLSSSNHPVATSPSQMIKQEPRPSERHEPPPPVPARALQQRSEKSSATTKSHVETKPNRSLSSVAQSYLKPPERYATKASSVSTPAITLSNTVGTARAHSTTPVDQHANPRALVAVSVKSQPPDVPERANTDSSNKSFSKTQVHVHFACPEQDEDDELLSAEEKKLLQSLEKLDNRLTKLNSDTKQQQQQHKRDKSVSPDCRTTGVQSSSSSKATGRALSTRGSRQDDSSIEIADFVDDDVVAAASYGGGAHCKSGQVTSALERSCYSRRTEMSSGLHKLRVRTGGAMVQESNNNSANLDKDGKHKVVVKRDLAHLLF